MNTKFMIIGCCGIAFFAFAWGKVTGLAKSDPAPVASNPKLDESTISSVAIVYSEKYLIDLGGLERFHPFDIHKYKKIVARLQRDGVLKDEHLFAPEQITDKDILRVQSQAFLDSLKDKNAVMRYLEADALRLLPLSLLDTGVLKPFRYSAGGTILAADLALKSKSIAINIGGGYHHAKPDKGEGFCIYADIPIAIRKLQAEKKIKRALIIDVDAHQGNGTIKCLEKDKSTFCFSMHQSDIYPHPKEAGDLDISLKRGTGDDDFLKILKESLPKITKIAQPDIIFVVGGCDPLTGDPLAGLEMTPAGIVKRDEMIIEFAVKKKIPIVFTLAGGYSKDAWKSQYESVKNVLTKYNSKSKSAARNPSNE